MAEASSDDVITLRIRFKSETVERFIERYGGDLGPDQVFVRTRQPLAIGTPIAFEFTLNDGSPLLSGRGTVAWSRSEPDAAGPAGMGVQFTSLPAASWQTVRRVLAARGAETESVTPPPVAAPSGPRRSTTPGTPAVVTKPAPTAEEADRTEVARMPPTFFETAAEGGPRNLARATDPGRARPVQPEPARAVREQALVEDDFFQNLLDDEVEEVTSQLVRPEFRPHMAETRPQPRAELRPEPRAPQPARPEARRGTPALGTPAPVAAPPRGPAMPAWTNPTPPRGVNRISAQDLARELAASQAPASPPAAPATYPYDEPVSSTAPTLPATAAVMLYDPDDPRAPLQPAARGPASVPMAVAPPAPASAQVMAAPMAPANAYQEGFYPPSDEAGGYPEAGYPDGYPDANFDPVPYAGNGRPTGGRATGGRLGPAISPEEMALAATAVRGLEGEAPVWPGIADEPRRGGTAKIWLALVLAAGGVIAAILWVVPVLAPNLRNLLSSDPPAEPGATPAPAPGPAPEGTTPAPSGASPAPAGSAAPAPAANELAAAVPAAPAEPAAPPAEPAPSKRRPALAEGDAPPAPRARRRRREPAEVIAEAESRGQPAAEAAPAPGAAALPSPAPGAAAVPEAAPTEGAGAEDVYWLSVRSTPSGADVIIDGQAEGKTPFTRRIFDPTRSYALVVRKPGFTSIERTVTGGSDWTKRGNVRTLTVTARLDPVPGAEAPAAAPATPPATGKTNPFDEPVTPPPVARP